MSPIRNPWRGSGALEVEEDHGGEVLGDPALRYGSGVQVDDVAQHLAARDEASLRADRPALNKRFHLEAKKCRQNADAGDASAEWSKIFGSTHASTKRIGRVVSLRLRDAPNPAMIKRLRELTRGEPQVVRPQQGALQSGRSYTPSSIRNAVWSA